MHNSLDASFTNGRVCALDRSQTRAEALAVANGALVAVATTVEVLRHGEPSTWRIELNGRRVVPDRNDIRTDHAEAISEREIEHAAESARFIESLLMPSSMKHGRQRHRISRDVEALTECVREFHLGQQPPRVQHFAAPTAKQGAMQ